MTALQITGWKSAPEIREVPKSEAGPGQVVIKVAGAGVCHSDLHLLHDFDAATVPFQPPFTLGHENTGWVHEVGAGVTEIHHRRAGGRVRSMAMRPVPALPGGMENYCEHAAEIGVGGGGLGLNEGMAEFGLPP